MPDETSAGEAGGREALSDERLAEIRAREAAATPGPWTWTPGMIEAPRADDGGLPNIIMDVTNIPGDFDEDDASAALGSWGSNEEARANLAFLAAAREDVPMLLAEVERLRGDWLRQAAQLNRIGAAVGHALILRATDDADAEEVRVAMERACEDIQDILAEAHQAAEQRTERYRALCANLINGGLARERDAATQRAETAERALAEMRERVGELGDEWSYETLTRTGWRRCTTSMTEEYARKRAGDSDRNRLVHRKASKWREVTDG